VRRRGDSLRLIGFQPNYNGQLWINPHPVTVGFIKINDLIYKGNTFDIELAPDKLTVARNNLPLFDGVPEK